MLHIYVCWLMPGSVEVLLSEVFDDFSSVPRDQSGWRLGMFIFHTEASRAGGWDALFSTQKPVWLEAGMQNRESQCNSPWFGSMNLMHQCAIQHQVHCMTA